MWTAIGAGAVAAGLYGVAVSQAATLDLADVHDDASLARYQTTRDRAGALRWAAVGVGGAAAGLLLWTLLRDDDSGGGAGAIGLGVAPAANLRGVAVHLSY